MKAPVNPAIKLVLGAFEHSSQSDRQSCLLLNWVDVPQIGEFGALAQ